MNPELLSGVRELVVEGAANIEINKGGRSHWYRKR